MIGSEQSNASQWAKKVKRRKQTVLKWVHDYNEAGPERIIYQATGGAQPKLKEIEKKRS